MTFFRNNRFWILVASFALSQALYHWSAMITPEFARTQWLVQVYALIAVAYLYVALLATPLYTAWPKLPYRGSYIKARRAIGVSAFYFGFMHAALAFGGLFGGWAGLAFFEGRFLWALIAAGGALTILLVLTLTSTDWAVRKLGYKAWKNIHRLVYLAGVLILFHALTMGSHFVDLSGTIPVIFLAALSFLLILEANRIRLWWRLKTHKTE